MSVPSGPFETCDGKRNASIQSKLGQAIHALIYHRGGSGRVRFTAAIKPKATSIVEAADSVGDYA